MNRSALAQETDDDTWEEADPEAEDLEEAGEETDDAKPRHIQSIDKETGDNPAGGVEEGGKGPDPADDPARGAPDDPTAGEPDTDASEANSFLTVAQALAILQACQRAATGTHYGTLILDELNPSYEYPPELVRDIQMAGISNLIDSIVADMIGSRPTPGRTVNPHSLNHHSEVMRIAVGDWPGLLPGTDAARAGANLPLYIDTSDSMQVFYNFMYRVILGCSEQMEMIPYTWTDELHLKADGSSMVTMEDIRSGTIVANGSTDVNTALAHILTYDPAEIKCALIFSDFFTGYDPNLSSPSAGVGSRYGVCSSRRRTCALTGIAGLAMATTSSARSPTSSTCPHISGCCALTRRLKCRFAASPKQELCTVGRSSPSWWTFRPGP